MLEYLNFKFKRLILIIDIDEQIRKGSYGYKKVISGKF